MFVLGAIIYLLKEKRQNKHGETRKTFLTALSSELSRVQSEIVSGRQNSYCIPPPSTAFFGSNPPWWGRRERQI